MAGENRLPVLEARGIAKRYGSVTALEGVDFEVYSGEICALIGDNGAGKSTLVKILSGAVRPDSGIISLRGQPVEFHNPRDARAAGVETVYQDLALAPDLDVAANLFLGREIKRPGFLGMLDFYDQGAMRDQAARHLKELKVNLRSIRQTVETLSGGQRQSVAVARAVLWGKDIVILDEPTAALGVAQSGMVLELMKRVRDTVRRWSLSATICRTCSRWPTAWWCCGAGRAGGTLYPDRDSMEQRGKPDDRSPTHSDD